MGQGVRMCVGSGNEEQVVRKSIQGKGRTIGYERGVGSEELEEQLIPLKKQKI